MGLEVINKQWRILIDIIFALIGKNKNKFFNYYSLKIRIGII